MQRIASCHKITTKERLLEWIDGLPVYITTKRRNKLLQRVRESRYEYVLWRTAKIFTVW
jgi:hypothetical protein